MVVEPIVPEEPTTKEEENEALSVETSNPVGAVTVMPASMFAPDTVKLSEEDSVPEQPEKDDKEPVAVITGTVTQLIEASKPASVTEPSE